MNILDHSFPTRVWLALPPKCHLALPLPLLARMGLAGCRSIYATCSICCFTNSIDQLPRRLAELTITCKTQPPLFNLLHFRTARLPCSPCTPASCHHSPMPLKQPLRFVGEGDKKTLRLCTLLVLTNPSDACRAQVTATTCSTSQVATMGSLRTSAHTYSTCAPQLRSAAKHLCNL